jgi:predicted DNA-binding transcriptional regulator YafY
MDERSPTARALRCLTILQESPGITAERLGERLGVTSRAARRYVATLRDAGIPVESERGPYGGYHLGRGLRLPPLVFSAPEALGLVMAVLDGHHDPDGGDPAGTALAKLLRALPDGVAAQAQAVRRTTAPAPDRGAARPDPTTTSTLVQACVEHTRLRLGYRSEAGTSWTVEVDPWAVVVRHGRWYLLCWSHRADALRAYRVDRVGAVDVLEQRFDAPADLDPVAALEEHLAVGWEFEVEVEVEAPVEQVEAHLPRALGRLEACGEGRTRLRGSTSNPRWYAAQLTASPAAYRVVGGAEVREATRALGERLRAAAGE